MYAYFSFFFLRSYPIEENIVVAETATPVRTAKRKQECKGNELITILDLKRQKFELEKGVLQLQQENLLLQNIKLQIELRNVYKVEVQLEHTPIVHSSTEE